jgi:hypothetical protein
VGDGGGASGHRPGAVYGLRYAVPSRRRRIWSLLKGKPEVVGDCCLEGLTKVLSFGLCETESAMTALAAAEEEAAE